MAQGSHPIEAIVIREVTVDSLQDDLAEGRIDVPPHIPEGLPEGIGSGALGFYVAEALYDGSPRGQVGVNWAGARKPEIRELTGDTPGISFLGVSEAHLRQGIGTTLMQKVFDEAEARGHTGTFLVVEADNEPALGLYNKLGFSTVTTMTLPTFNKTTEGTFGRSEDREVFIMTRPNTTN